MCMLHIHFFKWMKHSFKINNNFPLFAFCFIYFFLSFLFIPTFVGDTNNSTQVCCIIHHTNGPHGKCMVLVGQRLHELCIVQNKS